MTTTSHGSRLPPQNNAHTNTVAYHIHSYSAKHAEDWEIEPLQDGMQKHRMTRLSQCIRRKAIQEVEQDRENDKHIDMVNIKSPKFSSIRSVIVAKLDIMLCNILLV